MNAGKFGVKDIQEQARAMGLDVDESRAQTIALRLAGIIDELDMIPTDQLDTVEPAMEFHIEQERIR